MNAEGNFEQEEGDGMVRKPPQKQPALEILRAQARTIRGVARLIGVPHYELRNVVHGHYRPTPAIRDQLPVVLQTPLSALFLPDMLTPPRGPLERSR